MSCDFHEPYFGASYPDACCIDGYLWDLDSCDAPGGDLTSGGDEPCPKCNHAEFMARVLEEKSEDGYCAWEDKAPRQYKHRKLRCESAGDEDECRTAWLRGYDAAEAESKPTAPAPPEQAT